MLSLIGPAAAAEEPLLALRLRHHVASLPALSQRQLRLLAYRSQSERRPRHSGGTPRHTPGTAGVVRHGPLSHLLHTDLALPADVIALRQARERAALPSPRRTAATAATSARPGP